MKLDKKKMTALVVALALVLAGGAALCVTYLKPYTAAVRTYKEAVSSVEEKNGQLDAEINSLQDLTDAPGKPLDASLLDTAKETIKKANAEKVVVGSMPGKTDEITERAQELNQCDYSENIKALQEVFAALTDSKKQYEQLTNPSEEFVLQRLLTVDEVAAARAATEEQDPNRQLHKSGGYTSAIFFESANVNQSRVFPAGKYSDPVLDKGTDAGGSLEVYETEEDAVKRDSYLANFDGTVLNSGSHTVAGTVVIRTSNLLTAAKQKALEEKIIDALARLE